MKVTGLRLPCICSHHIFSYPLRVSISRTETLFVHIFSSFRLCVSTLILVSLEWVWRPILINSLSIRWLLERRCVHLPRWSNLRRTSLERMSRKSAEIILCLLIWLLLVISWLVKPIRSKQYYLVITIIIQINIELILSMSIVRNCSLVRIWLRFHILRSSRPIFIRWRLWKLTHYRTIYESLCNLTHSSCPTRRTYWKTRGLHLRTSWLPSLIIEVGMSTSLIWWV